MNCSHCKSMMTKTQTVIESRAKQSWYECALCGHEHTHSEPYQNNSEHHDGNHHRYVAASSQHLKLV